MHTLPIQIRFNDVDQMGHINNAVIMEYFDLGKAAYFTSIGIPPQTGDFTVMIVHFEVDFHRQIHYTDPLQVITAPSSFGTKSLHITQQVVNAETLEPYATCKTVMVGYSRLTNSSAPIPEELKAKMELWTPPVVGRE